MKSAQFIKILREKQLLLPPLSGYTDYPFRMILAGFQPPFLTTEMANARAILQNNWRTLQILKIAEGRHYNGVQIVGSSPEYMKRAAVTIQDLGFDYIDINMGCTARKVACRGEGISLMKQEQRAYEIVKEVTDAVDLPVTCKVRLGVSKNSINVLSLSEKLVDAGAVALTIHGRSGDKKFGVPLDLNIIRKTVQAMSVPIVANGGIYTGEDAQVMIQKTGAAAVMPGRGLLGNPWLVTEIQAVLSGKDFTPPILQQRKEICLRHLGLLVDFYGEQRAILRMRSILPHYFSKCMFLKELKKDVVKVNTTKDLTLLIERIQDNETHLMYTK